MASTQDKQSSEVVSIRREGSASLQRTHAPLGDFPLSQPADISSSSKLILGISFVGAALWLAAWVLSRSGRDSLFLPVLLLLLAIPLCWLVMLYACVRSVLDLVRRPDLRSVRNIAVVVVGMSLLLLVAVNLLLSPRSGAL